MQLGFVIDHSRCIGCHACTIACKSENDVPLGSFRTWVKYVEQGTWPQVRRSFAVLRCNQCTNAPCITICPVTALDKRPDGIVDIDPDRCIGCKSCLQACPYDALYIHEEEGTAQKCHFCAHRTERGLAPACAVVCPTEAIIPGDFDDPTSLVARLRDEGGLSARKTEAGTGPNVLYREAEPAALDPGASTGGGGYLWADRRALPQADAEAWQAARDRAQARTVYDIQTPPAWGARVSAYLLTKSIAAGSVLVLMALATLASFADLRLGASLAPWLLGSALGFLAVTTVLLVADLKRPDRFLWIVLRPQWSSWLTRGAFVLAAYGALLGLWVLDLVGVPLPLDAVPGLARVLGALTALAAALSAMYTAWLFGQAKGRVLWMRRGLAWHLLVQALVAGAAWALLAAPLLGDGLGGPSVLDALRLLLAAGLLAHLAFVLLEGRLAPRGREAEYERAEALVRHGPFVGRRRLALGLGILAPLVLLAATAWAPVLALAGVLALVGLALEEDLLVRAGQALPIH